MQDLIITGWVSIVEISETSEIICANRNKLFYAACGMQ